MNLRKLQRILKAEGMCSPVDDEEQSTISLYCYDEVGEFIKKIDIMELDISLSYNVYGRQLITVSCKVWWEDSNNYIKNNTTGMYVIRYVDYNKNEICISEAILTSITTSNDPELFELELYTNNMDYFTKELTHMKF